MAILRTDKPSNANNFDVDSVIYASSYLNSNQAAIPIFNSSIEFGLFSDFEISQVTSYLSTYSGLGVLIAGNGSGSIDDLCLSEAFSDFYSLSNLLVVGSSNYFDNASVFSNFSSTHVDLFAPGESLSTFPRDGSNNNEPTWFDGTCGAAPLVTGTAALMLSVNPNLTTAQLKSLIMNNVDVDSSKDIYNNCVSHGRLNTYKAVKAAIPEITTLNSFVNGIQSLPAGRHQFYKIVLPEADTYTFETSGNLYTSGYLYGDIQSSPIASSTNQSGNFSLSYYTFKSRSIYLKVVNNSSTSGTYCIKITPSHTTHTYNDHYSWYDGYYHKAYCSCGLYQLKPHIVNGPVGGCIFCNGPYTGLMNNPLLDPVVIGNDSRILSNGTIILGNIDYNLYLSGKLDLNSLIGGETI